MKNSASENIKQARTCIACGQTVAKKSLLRVVRTLDGKACFDASGHADGRGAYICKSAECVARARKKQLFDRQLNVKADDSLYDALDEVCVR